MLLIIPVHTLALLSEGQESTTLPIIREHRLTLLSERQEMRPGPMTLTCCLQWGPKAVASVEHMLMAVISWRRRRRKCFTLMCEMSQTVGNMLTWYGAHKDKANCWHKWTTLYSTFYTCTTHKQSYSNDMTVPYLIHSVPWHMGERWKFSKYGRDRV